MGIATLIKSAQLSSPELCVLTDDQLQKLQRLLVEMTGDFAAICGEYGFNWLLCGGSVLGAIRHGGFIPWDDDMDLCMPRADFEKFKDVFPGRFSNKYELKLPGDPGYLYHFPKIYRKNTLAQNIQSAPDADECICLDIFILENASDSRLARTAHGFLCTGLLLIDSLMRMERCKNNLLKYGGSNPALCSAVKKRALFAACFSFLTLEQWLKLSDRIFALCRNKNSRLTVIPSGNGHYFGELYQRRHLMPPKQAAFGDAQFFIPATPEHYLKIRYGDGYRNIPPAEDRERHAYIRFDFGDAVK